MGEAKGERRTECVVSPSMTKLMPPILSDDLVLVDLVLRPLTFVFLVQKDSLEDVSIEGDVLWKL